MRIRGRNKLSCPELSLRLFVNLNQTKHAKDNIKSRGNHCRVLNRRDILKQLADHKPELMEKLWTVAESPEKGRESQRLRAASALALYDPANDKAGVVVTPGRGYGERGEGFFRISLTVADARLDEALARIKAAFS